MIGDEVPTLARDLALIGYPLVASCEVCRCAVCSTLDQRHDVDALAARPDGRLVFVSYRAQPDYRYRTITIRWVNDKSNPDVQLAKMFDGRSRADLYVQGYPPGVAYAWADVLMAGFRAGRTKSCDAHPAALTGSGGQLFVVACESCAGVIYVPRQALDDLFADLVF